MPGQHAEPHDRSRAAARLNRLRAGVLGANDGIVSTAALVVGVAVVTSSTASLLTAGVAGIYQRKGLSAATALTVARELTQRDAFAAHADVELGIDPDGLTNPWRAAGA